MITIIDYGLGNIQSFQNLYKRLNIETKVANSFEDLTGATKLILPGVGAFDHAIELLEISGMKESIQDLVFNRNTPILGVCVGMQILANSSEEGNKPGLGWIPGRVKKFQFLANSGKLPMPHMGWNDVISSDTRSDLFQGLQGDSRFYFLHSYFYECENESDISAKTEYGVSFSCAIQRNNIYGVQFHPEKSHHYGERLLLNFALLPDA
ncbi:imidazole glycerol phosphate synthase subunit HisH [Leptospira brenneri]|uniref:Imidazole glycerol phosphate synthase subunit HisH n=1 Tax=Leptospira brenneri TaxID=2023182 RepID=A0A2M9Y1R5_9LEPT|nr:imidazole glycerol phosphate synthase subunit HisH [Leptospira brenneri]PJZ45501.1 imidazole glycerol phosphate synthase subunit HisH [Leptospira brenneri]TGK91993.1 imidazole glycerol phosphate synthase subunit HisH [Leptospira brenneri]